MNNNQSSLLNNQMGNQMNSQMGVSQMNNQMGNNQMAVNNQQIYPQGMGQQYGRNAMQNAQQIHQQQAYANPYLNQTYQYQPTYQFPQQSTYYPNQMMYGMNGMQNMNIQQRDVQQNDDQEIKWVQGEAGAKAYLLAPNKRVMLMDSESDTFYIKSTDMNGVPLPLRIFDFHERRQEQSQKGQLTTNANINMQSAAPMASASTVQTSAENINRGDINASNYITREEFEQTIANLKNIASVNALSINNNNNNNNSNNKSDDINTESYRRNNDESFIQSSGRQQNAKPTKQHAKHSSAV